jgi:hypothetical protein
MSSLLQDLRYGLRMLRKNPGFTAVAVLTLALGIGANTAIFTLVDTVMLRSLPVVNPQQLYRIGNDDNCCVIGGMQDNWGIFSYALYQEFREHTPEFSEMAAFQAGLQNLSVRRSGSPGAAEPYVGELVSGNYFSMFGISAFAGRALTPEDDKPNAAPVAVMSYRTWKQRFGLDPLVIGATLTFDTVPYTVAGIVAPGFFGDTLRPDPPDFWLPLATEPVVNGKEGFLNRSGSHWLYIIGRLKSGVKLASVQSKVTVELQRWLSAQSDLTGRDRPKLDKQHIVLAPAGGGVASLQSNYKAGLRPDCVDHVQSQFPQRACMTNSLQAVAE